MHLRLKQLQSPHWVAKLETLDESVWTFASKRPAGCLWSVTQTDTEVSVVSPFAQLPQQTSVEGPWRVFEVPGPLDFSLVGVIHHLTQPLKSAHISVFVVSSYDTDYLLVSSDKADDAVAAWVSAGVRV